MSSNLISSIIFPGQTVPPKVLGVTAEGGPTEIVVTWLNVTANPIVISYSVRYRVSPAGAFTEVDVGLVLTHTITGLINGTLYDVQVAANNAEGQGKFSDVVTATPEDVPAQVQNLIVSVGAADNSLDIEWDALGVTPDSYTYQFKKSTEPEGSYVPVNNGLSITATISSLASGVIYNVRIFATNGVGNGPNSSVVSNTPQGVPEQISNLAATPGIIQSNQAWTAPTAAPALTSYDIEFKLNADSTFIPFEGTGLSASVDIFNLDASLYDFRVRGVNSKGNGAFSAIAQSTPTAIGFPKVVEWNEKGVDTVNDPIQFINNTGTFGATSNLTVFNNQSNCTPNIHKDKNVWQNNGSASVRTAVPPTNMGSQATFIWVGIPFFLNGNNRRVWGSSFETSSAIAQQFNTFIEQNGSFLGTSGMSFDSVEWILYGRLGSTSSSFIRIIKNDGSTDNSAGGFAGSGLIQPEIMGWQFAANAGEDFPAQNFELTFYDGLLSTAEENALINAMKQKWFDGIPGPG